MANKKKDPKDIKKRRCISLSDNEIREMKILTGKDSLTESIRDLKNFKKQFVTKKTVTVTEK